MQNMAEDESILIVRRMITLSITNPLRREGNGEHGDEINSEIMEATFYVSNECDETTLANFVRQYRTRMEIDSLLKWTSTRGAYGRMQGEFDIPKFQRLKAVHLYFWYLAWGHERSGEDVENANKPTIYCYDQEWIIILR